MKRRVPTLDEYIAEQQIFEAGGQAAGKLELVQTKPDQAKEYAENELQMDVYKEIPEFDKNYQFAQDKAKIGWTQRKDMPVITDKDVKALQKRLQSGNIDINPPHPGNNVQDPFPEGLQGQMADEWLENGLKDGTIGDDKINVKMKSMTVGDLKPIQQQIYFDKAVEGIAQFGAEASKKFYQSTFFIASNDGYIIDGHHRFLGATLIDPKMKVKVLTIDLPIEKLLPMAKAYGDAIGNQRNQ